MRSEKSGTRTEPFTIEMRDGILWIDWRYGTSVSDADAVALIQRVNAISANVCPPMLVELNGMVTLSRNALSQFAEELSTAAMALIGPSAVDRTLADHFVKVHHPHYPTRYFPGRDEALTWLSGYYNAP